MTDPNYKEFWSDELQLFHNPNAKILLPANWLPDLTQHWFKNGQQCSVTSEGPVQVSMTTVVQAKV